MKKVLLAVLLLFPALTYAEMDVEVQLTWAPPTENADGSPLSDLQGYNIWYGFGSGSYTQSITVADALTDSFSFPVNGVASGTEIFVSMTAYDFEGNESAYSNEVSFGPFIVTDVTAPAAPTLSGSAVITFCPSGSECVN
jgi:hypothetical protein